MIYAGKVFDFQCRLDRHVESDKHRSLAEILSIVAQQLSFKSCAEVFKLIYSSKYTHT